jgi:oligopeptide transport system ATP-binding protein
MVSAMRSTQKIDRKKPSKVGKASRETNALLTVQGLNVQFKTREGIVKAANDINFQIQKGECIGIVGESGSGKSQVFMSIMGLLANNGKAKGSVKFFDKEILGMPISQLNDIRGSHISMIFQDPMTSLNPYMTIGKQLTEVLHAHKTMSNKEATDTALEMLDHVRIPEAERRFHMYPHEFSGGMRQRVMIAMALLCSPELLIADEPTTALDVTVQAQVIDLIKNLRSELNTSIIMITHDLGVVAGLCDRVLVMYAGRIVESGPVRDIFYSPQHPYTKCLLKAMPRIDEGRTDKLETIPGRPPNLMKLPHGCSFEPRCPYRMPICKEIRPELLPISDTRAKACHLTEI